MTRNEILEYVEKKANGVADLARVQTIRRTTDPRLARIETGELIRKYGDEYEMATRSADFEEIFGEDW
jgi:hypothetical protein